MDIGQPAIVLCIQFNAVNFDALDLPFSLIRYQSPHRVLYMLYIPLELSLTSNFKLFILVVQSDPV